MKKTTKVVLSSAMSIVMCASLITGSTFALFTSESEVNVAITSGKVEVVATVDSASLKTYSMGEEQTAGTFETGGTAKVDGNSLTLERIAAGDKVKFTVQAENKSTISVKYRLKLECEECDMLMAGMLISVNETPYENIVRFTGAWQEMEKDATVEIPLSFELPSTAGNEYQGLTGKIVFSVEAVQSNGVGETTDEVLHYTRLEVEGETAEEKFESFTATLDEVKKAGGGKVELTDNLEIKGEAQRNSERSNFLSGGTEFDLGGKELSINSQKGFDGFYINEVDPEKEIVIENGIINYTREQYVTGDAVLYLKLSGTSKTAPRQKVVLRKVTVNVTGNEKSELTGLTGKEAIRICSNAELTLEDCTINGDICLQSNLEESTTANIINSTVNGMIKLENGSAVVNMIGGTYNPCDIRDGLSRFNGTVSFTGTHITKDLFFNPCNESTSLTLDGCTMDGSIFASATLGQRSEASELQTIKNRIFTTVTVRNTTFTKAVKTLGLAIETEYADNVNVRKAASFNQPSYFKSVSYIGCTFEQGVDLTYLDVSCTAGGFVLFDGCTIKGDLNAKLHDGANKAIKVQLKGTKYGSITGEQGVNYEIV